MADSEISDVIAHRKYRIPGKIEKGCQCNCITLRVINVVITSQVELCAQRAKDRHGQKMPSNCRVYQVNVSEDSEFLLTVGERKLRASQTVSKGSYRILQHR